jgi:hypothetical protein
VVEWANINMEASACHRLFHKFPEVFAEIQRLQPESLIPLVADKWRGMLRAAWETTNMRLRDWHLYELRHAHATRLNQMRRGIDPINLVTRALAGDQDAANALLETSQPLPEATHIEAALWYLQSRAIHRMRICANEACGTKYFLRSETNAKQTTCSTDCADIVRKAIKRQWWTTNRGKGAI